MTDEEWIKISEKILETTHHPLMKRVCEEVLDRFQKEELPKRRFGLRERREYMREYMRKKRARKKLESWRERLYADGKVPDRRAIDGAASEARKSIAVIEEDRNPFEDV